MDLIKVRFSYFDSIYLNFLKHLFKLEYHYITQIKAGGWLLRTKLDELAKFRLPIFKKLTLLNNKNNTVCAI